MFKKYTKSFKKFFLEIILLIYDTFLLSVKKTSPRNTIAVIRLDAIGDFILYISSLDLVPTQYQKMRKALICNELVFEIAKSLNIFDEIIPINLKKFRSNFIYRKKMIKKVIELKSKVAIQPTFSRSFFYGDSIIRATRADIKIGFNGDFINQSKLIRNISDRWYTKLIKPENTIKMEIERNHEFFEKVSNKKINFRRFVLPVLTKLNIEDKSLKNYIVISPGASSQNKCWPIVNFQNLILEIIKKYKLKILLCGTKSESTILNCIFNNVDSNLLEIRVGKSLLEFIEIIRNAELVIGNNSSSVHIASMVNTKSICIYGGQIYGRFFPYPSSFKISPKVVSNTNCKKENWKCSKFHNCLEKISVKDIIIEFDKILTF